MGLDDIYKETILDHYKHPRNKRELPGAERFVLERSEWADWDRNGDLLFAREGAVFRLRAADLAGGPAGAVLLADFRERTFEGRQAPPDASHW